MQPQFPILLVDDDAQLRDILQRAAQITFPEAVLTQVSSTSEAISYINTLAGRGPKLVLLDVDLGGGLTGFDFMLFLRTHAEAHFLPIVMLTADRLSATIEFAYSEGVSCFTVKPTDFAGWQLYFTNLRLYWFSTVTIPTIRFRNVGLN